MAKEMAKDVKEAIKGLTFTTNRAIEDKDTKKKSYVPVERAMTEDDVLASRVDGEVVIIVSKDGTKHRIEKKAA